MPSTPLPKPAPPQSVLNKPTSSGGSAPQTRSANASVANNQKQSSGGVQLQAGVANQVTPPVQVSNDTPNTPAPSQPSQVGSSAQLQGVQATPKQITPKQITPKPTSSPTSTINSTSAASPSLSPTPKTAPKPTSASSEEVQVLPQPGTAVVRPISALEEMKNTNAPQPALARGSTGGAVPNSGESPSTSSPNTTSHTSPSIPPQVPPAFPGGTPPPPAQPPPRTLSALQSMSSSTLPGLPQDNPSSVNQVGGQPPTTSGNTTGGAVKGDGQPSSGGGADQVKPEVAQPKQSMLRFLPIAIVLVLILSAIGFAAYWFLGQRNSNSSTSIGTSSQTTPAPSASTAPTKSVDLEYWGLWEPSEAMEAVISDYEKNNPGVTITYKKQSHKDYRERLQNAIVSGNGPDLFRYHASWVPMLKQELAPLPSAVMTSSEFSSTFYPVAAEQLNVDGQIVGIPLMYEGLALYYNTEIFSTAVEEPPTTWPELRTIAKKLTVRAENGKIRAGAALGNATNVEHFADIIATLMLQNGADLTKPNSIETRDALLFYTNFMKVDQVWDASLPSSTVAFAQGDVAMMFAPSWRAHEVRAANPNLPFEVVPLPQLSDERIAWATYWAEGVSEQSENKVEAWQFIKYLSTADVQKQLHSEQSQARAFGELYSRKDLANELAGDPIMSAYLQDAPYARGGFMSTYTHDDGINDNIIKYYENAVTALVSGSGIDEVLETLDQGVRQELRQYGVAGTE